MTMDADPFADSSVGGAHGNATEVADVDVDSGTFKWTASADFDGDSGYLYYADDADWDFVADDTSVVQIDFWVKFADHAGVPDTMFAQGEGSGRTDLQWFYHYHGAGFYYQFQSGGTNIISTNYAGEITDTNWHHIVLLLDGDGDSIECAYYVDGDQEGYDDSNGSNDTLTGAFIIGEDIYWTASADFFNGNIDEFRIHYANDLNCTIDSSSPYTGTCDVPDGPHGAVAAVGKVIYISMINWDLFNVKMV